MTRADDQLDPDSAGQRYDRFDEARSDSELAHVKARRELIVEECLRAASDADALVGFDANGSPVEAA